ncbi:hypothetical protein [Mesorhizobium sp.]|uniref:hypothetical protein n=1 Tax=Mesorhizobium sp. TaxID=1871066 RepID=UPI000FE9ED05|nr:hypothetical protein [Mesorhizobium sp.]RWO88563.1 MAG: hypothetical protein EOQ95_18330 [Mesorhizobium sp.]
MLRLLWIGAISIGALGGFSIGLLIGMSNAPIAGVVVTSILSGVPAVLTLSKNRSAISHQSLARIYVSIAALFLTLPIGLAAGIHTRKSNWYQGSPYAQEKSDLVIAGFTAADALALIRARLEKGNYEPGSPSIHFKTLSKQTCSAFEPARYGADIEAGYRQSDASPWKEYASWSMKFRQKLSNLDEANQEKAVAAFLTTLWEKSCQSDES